jgi:hypothetical protein
MIALESTAFDEAVRAFNTSARSPDSTASAVGRGSDHRIIHASRAIEHPGGNLKPPGRIGAAQRAAENNMIWPGNRLVDKDRQATPWMPSLQELAETGTVGVIKPGCTMEPERIGL